MDKPRGKDGNWDLLIKASPSDRIILERTIQMVFLSEGTARITVDNGVQYLVDMRTLHVRDYLQRHG